MFVQCACHFKHGYLILNENRFQICICIDHAFVLLILQVVFLDINPDFFHDFSSGQRFVSHNFGQRIADRKS